MLRPEFEEPVLALLESAKTLLQSTLEFNAWDAGHVFKKFGKYFARPDFVEVAESFYEKAGLESGRGLTFSRDLAEAREIRAALLSSTGKTSDAEALREANRKAYWTDWRQHSDEFGFLAEATEYLVAHFLLQPKSQISAAELQELLVLALRAESLGEEHYWSPYESLFWIHLLLGNESDALLWLARGYFSLNIDTEEKLLALHPKIKGLGFTNTAEFVKRLLNHLQSVPEKSMFYGAPPRDLLLKWTLSDIENQLKVPDFRWSRR
jgi:hypothetical protein